MICFARAEDDDRVRKLTWLGINKDTYARTSTHESYKWMYDVEDVGYKYHGNSIMAAIALVQLKYLDRDNAYRQSTGGLVQQNLSGVTGVSIVPTAPRCKSSRHLFQIRVQKRDELILALINPRSIRVCTTATIPNTTCIRMRLAPVRNRTAPAGKFYRYPCTLA